LKGKGELAFRRDTFARVGSLWTEKVGIWCALDFEAWEMDHTVITEFGWRTVSWSDGRQEESAGHIIVAEHEKYRNTKWIADRRYVRILPTRITSASLIVQNYNFGTTETIKKMLFGARVRQFVADLAVKGPVFLVFHDNSQDIKYEKGILFWFLLI
jgi:hypothetical protein